MTSMTLGGSFEPAAEDAALARAACEGSARAAGALFDRHAPLVRRILLRALGPFQEVEDHVQEAFLAFFRRLPDLRSDDAVRAFLVSITLRVARRELRRRRIRRILRLSAPADLAELAGEATGADIEGREAVRHLFAILDEVDTASRLVFTLRHLEGMELTEVAAALGESLSTVKRRLARTAPVIRAKITRDPVLAAYTQELDHDV